MKKTIAMGLIFVLILSLVGCRTKSTVSDIEGNMKSYSEMSDGTWQCNGNVYKYRLVISGTLPNAEKVTTFVYLSNLEEISFEQAWKAAGLSSNSNDYFNAKDAVVVEVKRPRKILCKRQGMTV